jgi:acetyltransferase
VQPWTTTDGISLLIRPIRPEDEPLMIQFHTTLSDRSVYFRYMHAIQLSQRIAHDRLSRICFNDYDRELALVAEREHPPDALPSNGGEGGAPVPASPGREGGVAVPASPGGERGGMREILAVGRLSKLHGRNEAEFAIIIGDEFQGHGLGTELLRRLLQVGRDEQLDRIIGFIASDNTAMQRVCEKLGFRLHRSFDDPEVKAVIDL